jgi:hypothetical protein
MLLHRERCLHISQMEGKVTDRMPLLRLKKGHPGRLFGFLFQILTWFSPSLSEKHRKLLHDKSPPSVALMGSASLSLSTVSISDPACGIIRPQNISWCGLGS